MFVRMLTVHCDQNNSYEMTINGFQVRKINEIRNIIFSLRYGKPSSALRPKLGCSPSWVLDEIQIFWGKPCLNNKDSWPKLIQRQIRKQSKNSFLLIIRSETIITIIISWQTTSCLNLCALWKRPIPKDCNIKN